MAVREWSLEAEYVEYCNCDFGCPCETNAPPTHGICTGAIAFKITKGRCDDVSLDGLIVVATFYFPRHLLFSARHSPWRRPHAADSGSAGERGTA